MGISAFAGIRTGGVVEAEADCAAILGFCGGCDSPKGTASARAFGLGVTKPVAVGTVGLSL